MKILFTHVTLEYLNFKRLKINYKHKVVLSTSIASSVISMAKRLLEEISEGNAQINCYDH